MKLLLTSGGLRNESIIQALRGLAGKRLEDCSIVFISTASNVETGDKTYFINDLINIKNQNFKSIKITDISAVPESIWRPQLEESDILFFEGGSSTYLMESVYNSGLDKILPELLKNKVYVGCSAGSMITCPDLNVRMSKIIYGEDYSTKSLKGLRFIDFYILPHYLSDYFPERIPKNVESLAKELNSKVYALDDQSAIVVDGDVVNVVSEGKFLVID